MTNNELVEAAAGVFKRAGDVVDRAKYESQREAALVKLLKGVVAGAGSADLKTADAGAGVQTIANAEWRLLLKNRENRIEVAFDGCPDEKADIQFAFEDGELFVLTKDGRPVVTSGKDGKSPEPAAFVAEVVVKMFRTGPRDPKKATRMQMPAITTG